MSTQIITDYAGNSYPASRLEEQESPSWDPQGAKKDRAMQALGEIARDCANKTPRVGDAVTIAEGRKHKGKSGVVFWRGVDKYKPNPGRYRDSMQEAMAKAMGFDDRIGVRTETGEKFFVPLTYAKKS